MTNLLKTISNEIYELGGNESVVAIIQKEWAGTTFRFIWNDEEIEYLKQNVSKITVQQMADHFGVKKHVVECKLRHLRRRGKLRYSERSIYYKW